MPIVHPEPQGKPHPGQSVNYGFKKAQVAYQKREVGMDIQSRSGEDYTAIEIRGRLDATSAPDAEEAMTDAIQRGVTRLVINLAATDYVSSAGLRVLLATAKRLSRQGGQLVLCELQDGVREVFEISGLLTVLSVAQTEATAHSLVTA